MDIIIQREEFERKLSGHVFEWSDKSCGYMRQILGEDVARMVGFDQKNPHHCYDLFEHTLHTVAGLPALASPLLRTAAFFHDIGKPLVAMQKEGRLVFYGHAEKSALIARPILADLGYTEQEIEEICFYIRHHDDFIPWRLPGDPDNHDNPYLVEINEENLSGHISKVISGSDTSGFIPSLKHWEALLMLCQADASAQADIALFGDRIMGTKAEKLKKGQLLLNGIHSLEAKQMAGCL